MPHARISPNPFTRNNNTSVPTYARLAPADTLYSPKKKQPPYDENERGVKSVRAKGGFAVPAIACS